MVTDDVVQPASHDMGTRGCFCVSTGVAHMAWKFADRLATHPREMSLFLISISTAICLTIRYPFTELTI